LVIQQHKQAPSPVLEDFRRLLDVRLSGRSQIPFNRRIEETEVSSECKDNTVAALDLLGRDIDAL
jgi:hypothetical protein